MSEKPDDSEQHLPDEATPDEAPEQTLPAPRLGLHDSGWDDSQWRGLLEELIEADIGSWRELASLFLGHLNPSQVGTSLASSDGFKTRYGKGNTMRIVMDWAYRQTGCCADCGTRLELQADHIIGRETYDNPFDADFIENMTLRCRRCNVVRRPSHEFGGLTFLTAEAALMWIMMVIRPRTREDYIRMCRLYGMTMADIRMHEAWAMAHWLSRAEPPAYGIENDAESAYNLVLWPDSAITRCDIDDPLPEGCQFIHSNVPGTHILGFLTLQGDGRIKCHEQALSFIPFSTYDLAELPPQALCIRYTPPKREQKIPQEIQMLSPRREHLLCHAVRAPEQVFEARSTDAGDNRVVPVPENAPAYGRLFTKVKTPSDKIQIAARNAD